MKNRKAEINFQMVLIILALIVLFLILFAIFPSIAGGNTKFKTLICKYSPFGCKLNTDANGNVLTPEQERAEIDKMFDGLNKALRDTNKYTEPSVTIEQMNSIVKNTQCIQKIDYESNWIYLFKSNVAENKPIYMLITYPKAGALASDVYRLVVIEETKSADDMKKYTWGDLYGLFRTPYENMKGKDFYYSQTVLKNREIYVNKESYCTDSGGCETGKGVYFNFKSAFIDQFSVCPLAG